MDMLIGLALLLGARDGMRDGSRERFESEKVEELKKEIRGFKLALASFGGSKSTKTASNAVLAADLGISTKRLPAAHSTARALGIRAADLPAYAKDMECSVRELIEIYAGRTRAEVLADSAVIAEAITRHGSFARAFMNNQ